MILSRRRLFVASSALIAAPAIVRVASLMPVSVAPNYAAVREIFHYDIFNDIHMVRYDVIVRQRDTGLHSQFGLDSRLSSVVAFSANRRKDIDRLFAGIEELMRAPIDRAALIKPRMPGGTQ